MIIALHGKAGCGKDTFADHLVEKYGFVKRGFADPLYEEVAHAFDVTVGWLRDRSRKELPQRELALALCKDNEFAELMLETHAARFEESRSPRWVLQHWGTEYRRAQSLTYWVDQMGAFAKRARVGVAIPDCRFENEAAWTKQNEGRVINIVRPGVADVAAHSSEARLPLRLIDWVIDNTGTIEDLQRAADRFFVPELETA